MVIFFLLLMLIDIAYSFTARSTLGAKPVMSLKISRISALQMAVYSSDHGIPAALIEERDACGVGFIASKRNIASHNILQQALSACSCMEHRGATSADNISGDGAGVMTGIPTQFFEHFGEGTKLTNKDGSPGMAIGMVFLPRDQAEMKEAMSAVENKSAISGFNVLGWRDVPVDPSVLGELSQDFVPTIKQFVISASFDTEEEHDDAVYELRRKIQGKFRRFGRAGAYVCSLSTRTLVYKGMLRSCDLSTFFKDLTDPNFETSFAIYHRRFSTNTVPKWYLAQPMRLLAHNGEINTLLGNVNWVKSTQTRKGRANTEEQNEFKAPLVDLGRSDSANLDSVYEKYVRQDRSMEEALMVLVPEAYASQPKLDDTPEVKDFYAYHESLQESWDGPALLVFSDGNSIGATLDRNGLRPARYMITADKNDPTDETLHVMSEVGVTKSLPLFSDEDDADAPILVDAGRLGPGQILSLNMKTCEFKLNDEVKADVAARRPYSEWLKESVVEQIRAPFSDEIDAYRASYGSAGPSTVEKDFIGIEAPVDSAPVSDVIDPPAIMRKHTAFGWGTEDVEVQIATMASSGIEATSSMGDDAPLAALSSLPHTMFDYFKQRFAQVTNPPIDPLREGAVMSLNMFLGTRGDVLSLDGQKEKRIKIESPILNRAELNEIKTSDAVNMKTISSLYPLSTALTKGGLEAALDQMCATAADAVRAGATVIELSDVGAGDDSTHVFVPPLMAVAAVHHRLIEEGLRTDTSIIVTTGQAWSTHHVACLVGYGASAVMPYAAYESILNWHAQKRTQNAMARGDIPRLSPNDALNNYRTALDKGVLKIMSKIGISLLSSYHGAQIFEALGINDEVLLKIFKGTPSRVDGMGFDDLAAESAEFLRKAFGDAPFEDMINKVEGGENTTKLFNYGFLNFLKRGEFHHNNIPLAKTLHKAIDDNDFDMYKLYEESITTRPATTLRDILKFKEAREPVPLDEVEPIEDIMKRFCTGGMSLGALSREAHETLGIAMNRIGGKSNSGEGGEDAARRQPLTDVDANGKSTSFPHLSGLKNGDTPNSRIKQVASGRFGVTPAYLMAADQIEIKIAQGAKPGEGGQLPGKKINQYIATLRSSKPGVTLISPPPHHDIYSIEDLAQLIYDLHQINREAGVSVKLVSEVGIGTVASGVAKAGADIIQISGHDGGTAASPVSSVKHAGSPWELGLAEAHSVLRENNLRKRVTLRVDGGLKSGWDVMMAAAMGAEEFGFGTIAMIAEGCIMARVCHTNKCPVGVATQNEELRQRFKGTPDDVVTFFSYVAQETRHIMARLGFRTLDEVIGRQGLLLPRDDLTLTKCSTGMDPSFVIDAMNCVPVQGENFCEVDDDRLWLKKGPVNDNGRTFDDVILDDVEVQRAIASNGGSVSKDLHIQNKDRAAFSRVSGQIAKAYGDRGFKGELNFSVRGGAGQSFGAFLSEGMNIKLSGYANDYVAKGMNGGVIVISPPTADDVSRTESGRAGSASLYNVAGNTVLYGATGGEMFLRGQAGERFAVRNSGATAVVEGLGDHGCEYMTGGIVVCLGSTGRNLAAGMTGGLLFILDEEEWLDGASNTHSKVPIAIEKLINGDSAQLAPISADSGTRQFLKATLEKHLSLTGSKRAEKVLANLDEALSKFHLLLPESEVENPIVSKSKGPVSSEPASV